MGDENKQEDLFMSIPWLTFVSTAILVLKEWKVIKKFFGFKSFTLGKEQSAEIQRLIEGLGERYQLNRVTLSRFKKPKNPPVTLEDYKALKLSITHEFVYNSESIKDKFQNAGCENFADAMMLLDASIEGYIVIPPGPNAKMDNMIQVQNLYDVVKSYRFKIGPNVIDGSLALSFTHESYEQELDAESLQHIKNIARRIYLIINKK